MATTHIFDHIFGFDISTAEPGEVTTYIDETLIDPNYRKKSTYHGFIPELSTGNGRKTRRDIEDLELSKSVFVAPIE